jgi:hypothetical protein
MTQAWSASTLSRWRHGFESRWGCFVLPDQIVFWLTSGRLKKCQIWTNLVTFWNLYARFLPDPDLKYEYHKVGDEKYTTVQGWSSLCRERYVRDSRK